MGFDHGEEEDDNLKDDLVLSALPLAYRTHGYGWELVFDDEAEEVEFGQLTARFSLFDGLTY